MKKFEKKQIEKKNKNFYGTRPDCSIAVQELRRKIGVKNYKNEFTPTDHLFTACFTPSSKFYQNHGNFWAKQQHRTTLEEDMENENRLGIQKQFTHRAHGIVVRYILHRDKITGKNSVEKKSGKSKHKPIKTS